MSTRSGEGAASGGRTPALGIAGYEDPALIGEGGFARVYRARQPALNRLVAVKVLSKIAPDDRARRRFEQERATVGALSGHPNIVTVYESGLTDDGVPYLAMEYVPGGSLGDRLAREGPRGWEEVVHLGIRLAGALESAHRAGILHRDVKPENVLLSSFGEPQLSDFGIARVIAGPDTHTADRHFSVAHAAPEVLNGEGFSAQSDIYALGSTLFALLWGRAPFLGDDDDLLLSVVMRITRQPPPDLREKGVPDPVCQTLEQALAKRPGDRPDSALALAHELQQAQAAVGRPRTTPLVIADPEQVPEALRGAAEITTAPLRVTAPEWRPEPEPRSRSRRGVWLVVGVVVVVLLAGTLAGFAGWRDEDSAGPRRPTMPPAPTTSLVPAEPFPAGTSPVPAGTYFASRFTPPVGFTLPEGWRSVNGEGLNYLDLARADGEADSLVTLLRVRQAVDPTTAAVTPEEARAAMRPAPDNLVEWLHGHPRLATSDPSPVTKGALAGTVLEATPTDVYLYPSCGGGAPERRCVPLFESDDDSYFVPEGSRARFHVLTVGDDVVLAVVEAPADRFDAFAPKAEQVLSTLVVR